MEGCLKILILSFYFRPDLSAGSFRNSALVNSLRSKISSESQIDVITTLPNRYSDFSAKAFGEEVYDNVRIRRVKLPSHESGMIDQSRSFLVYASNVARFVAGRDYDVVVASSSRLMTAALGAWVARRGKVPLYLDVRDIFVDTIRDVLPRPLSILMKPLFSYIEKWTVSKADRLNVVSAGFLPYFQERYPSVSTVVFTNGIDDEFIQPSFRRDVKKDDKVFSEGQLIEVLYAGNMGEGQGLHTIVPLLAKRLEGIVKFRLIGGGGRKKQLEAAVLETGCSNVVIEPPIGRDELINIYKSADVLFLHLNDYEAFRKVLPSKLFEYGALGKPIWAGVAGYAASFVSEELDNAALFPPCDVDAAVKAFEKLILSDAPRESFVAKFTRGKIMDDMAEDILNLPEQCL